MTSTPIRPPASVAILSGDGTGLEMMREVRRVIDWFVRKRGLAANVAEIPFGLSAIRKHGSMLSEEDLLYLKEVDVILFGAAGGPEYDPIYDAIPREVRRTGSALRIRKTLGLFANLRPIRPLPPSAQVSPLKPEVLKGVDLLIVRELLGGAYFGEPRGVEILRDGDRRGVNTHVYLASQIRTIAEVAFTHARRRRNRLCSVEKAAVMEAGQMWREEIESVHARFPDVELEHMAVDTCAQLIIQDPAHFDVIVTDNMFGDILSDCASAIVGSVGYQASACLGASRPVQRQQGLYEPLDAGDFHLNGQNLCNPVGALLSLALALDITLERPKDGLLLTGAVETALSTGLLTSDVASTGSNPAKTSEIGDAVLLALDQTVEAALCR